MRRVLFSLCLSMCAFDAAIAAEKATGNLYTIEQLMAADGFSDLSFSPDGKSLLVGSARTGIRNLYLLQLNGRTELQPVTGSTRETVNSVGWFPDDGRILYLSDQGGNELNHLYVRETDGSIKDLTPGKVRARFTQWAVDGKSFFAVTNERDPRFMDLYEYSAADYSRKKLFENDQGYQVEAVSPDRRYVAMSRIADNATTHAYLYDTVAAQLMPLVPEKQGVVTTPRDFARDGSAIFYTTDEGTDFQHLVRQDLKTGVAKTIFAPKWDVDGARLTRDGRYLTVAVNQDARRVMHLLDPVTFKPAVKVETGPGTTSSFTVARNAPLAAFVQANGDVPGDLYLLDLKSGTRRQLLSSMAPGIAQADLVPGEVVRFKSYDGLTVPGIFYKPRNPPAMQRPGVLWVHGGPGGESAIGYKPMVQYLLNHGYAVYEVNNRGSSGSGKRFNHLDDHKHGDADLDDVVAAKRVLVEQAGVDPARIAIAGGSYGGFMTLAGLTFRPDAFAAGIDLYGVSNWPRLLQNTPPWWVDLNRLLATEMGDWKTEEPYLRSISPSFHAERIKRPLLVLQGANDPRVLPVESEDIVAKVKANDVPVEYVVFADEGHGFRKKANEIVAWETVLRFLDRHVKQAETAPHTDIELGR